MNKVLIVLVLFLLISCRPIRPLSAVGTVLEVNKEKGYVWVMFPCEVIKWEEKPCYGATRFDLKYFRADIEVKDAVGVGVVK